MGIYCEKCLKGEDKNILHKIIKLKRNEALKSLNSVIQCLFHIEPFVNYIKSKFYEINKRDIYNKFKASGKCLTDPLKNLLDELFPEKFEKTEDYEMKTKSESISTEDLSKIIYTINSKYNEKQDDLISFILSRLHAELNKTENINQTVLITGSNDKQKAFINFFDNFKKENKSIISDMFYGIYYLKYTCNNCGNNLYIFKNYIHRLYTLSQVYNYRYQAIESGTNNISEINIYDCLIYDKCINECQKECKKCHSPTTNEQKIIYTSPNILIFIINRNDIDLKFKFLIEENINISGFVEKQRNTRYELIGIIYNFDENRFKAYCKNYGNKQWTGYEDENILFSGDFQDIKNIEKNAKPYILFYQINNK